MCDWCVIVPKSVLLYHKFVCVLKRGVCDKGGYHTFVCEWVHCCTDETPRTRGHLNVSVHLATVGTNDTTMYMFVLMVPLVPLCTSMY